MKQTISILAKSVAMISVGYSGLVEYNTRRYMTKSNELIFWPGSADFEMNERLSMGDLVVFGRRWYYYHIPEALLIKTYKLIHWTDLDHCGVIITDNNGTPHVLESSFFGGYKLRTFEKRTLYSKAEQIIVIHLQPSGVSFNDFQKGKIRAYAESAAVSKEWIASEFFASGLGLLAFLFGRSCRLAPKLNNNDHNNNNSGTAGKTLYGCSNIQLIAECYRCLGLDLNPTTSQFSSCKQLMDRSFVFSHIQGQGQGGLGGKAGDATPWRRFLSREDVVVTDSCRLK